MPKKKLERAALVKKARELKKQGVSKEERRLALLRETLRKYCAKEKLGVDFSVHIQGLTFKHFSTRKTAARMLGDSKDKRAVKPLIYALKDSHRDVRAKAAESLGDLKDKRAIPPLIFALKDPDFGVRRHAAISLGSFAFVLVEGDKVATKKLRVADNKFAEVNLDKFGLLLYYLAANPVKLKKVPTDLKAKGRGMKFLIELREGVKGRSLEEVIEILGIGKKKGKK